MITKKTEQERLQELEQKLDQLKAKKQKLHAKIQQKERKERTRRLIQMGAIFEKYYSGGGELTLEEAEEIAQLTYKKAQDYLEKKRQETLYPESKENGLLTGQEDPTLIIKSS